MKFEMLKRDLNKNVHNHYLLTGNDGFLLQRAYSMIENAYNIKFNEMNINTYNSDTILCDEVVKNLETLPMLSDKRLVYINASTANTKLINQQALNEYLKAPSESSALIINIGENTKLLSIDTSKFITVDCNRVSKSLFYKYVQNEFLKNGKTINSEALDMLYSYTNGYLIKANSEVVKLVNFVGDDKNITINHVLENVSGQLEYQIYELTENLARKNAEKVFAILDQLKYKKDGQRGLLTLIYNHFRRMLHISLNNSLSHGDLAKLLGVKEYAVRKLSQQIGWFSKKQLRQICNLCSQLEYKTKTSAMQLGTAVNILIFFILNNELPIVV